MRFQICATVACLLGGFESTTASSLLAQHDSQLGLTESFLGGDELLQLDADSDASDSNSLGGKVFGWKSRGEKFAIATQEFSTKVAYLNKLWGEKKTAVNYKGEAYDYCTKGKDSKAFNKKSFEIEEELNEKLANLLNKRNDLAESIDKPKAALWTKDELSKKLNAKGGEATHEEIDKGMKKGLGIFQKRIETDFDQDEKTKVWTLKDKLEDNDKDEGRPKKINEMTEAMNLWAGSWKDKEINLMSSPTRYLGTQVFAESLIMQSCAKSGQEERSAADLAKDVAVTIALVPIYIIGGIFKAIATMPYWAVLMFAD